MQFSSPTFVELVDLVAQVGNDGIVLLPDGGEPGLVVEVRIVQLLVRVITLHQLTCFSLKSSASRFLLISIAAVVALPEGEM